MYSSQRLGPVFWRGFLLNLSAFGRRPRVDSQSAAGVRILRGLGVPLAIWPGLQKRLAVEGPGVPAFAAKAYLVGALGFRTLIQERLKSVRAVRLVRQLKPPLCYRQKGGARHGVRNTMRKPSAADALKAAERSSSSSILRPHAAQLG